MDKKIREIREDSFGLLLKKVSLRVENMLDHRLANVGLSIKTFGIIMLLLEDEGLTQKELGMRTEVPGYATTRALDALEKQGLIQRHPHPTSRRANLIYLTGKGQQLRGKLPIIIKEVNDYFLAACDQEERKILKGALARILENSLLD